MSYRLLQLFANLQKSRYIFVKRSNSFLGKFVVAPLLAMFLATFPSFYRKCRKGWQSYAISLLIFLCAKRFKSATLQAKILK
ncbi:hypothetical protein C7N43_09275 [Sphingobacteriales bacterium UPWRP_1]|nr:hypothetical protein B6N25_07940 [Sphingobacteriales bacterium TSM_CSS]PSJ77320.1 hypothetical protein C7N43_09275 [Sphingobacteriales bacterium UPWRP_1]